MFGVPRDLDQAKYYLERGAEAAGEFLWHVRIIHQKSVMVMNNSDMVNSQIMILNPGPRS
jgi:TPR repeat protein